ncbi:unnamed protein product, partial [Mesorhabditis spiculigera]
MMAGSSASFDATVSTQEVRSWERLYVVGSIPELGTWNPHKARELQKTTDGAWQVKVNISNQYKSIEYRYFIGASLDAASEGSQPINVVIKWESQLRPRRALVFQGIAKTKDTFGSYDGRTTVGDGWLCHEDERAFYVRIHGNALEIFPGKDQQKTYRVKMVPFDVRFEEMISYEPRYASKGLIWRMHSLYVGGTSIDENEAHEAQPRPQYPSFSETELSVLTRTDPVFGAQYQNGSVFRNNIDYLVFRTRTVALEQLAFCIELYEEKGTSRVGVAWALPAGLSDTYGKAKYAIINRHQQPMGQINVDYMIISPWKGDAIARDLMHITYGRHWKKRSMLEVGHRGMGVSYTKLAAARENTIHSLNVAAGKGADFVELDVQLTKDHLPVVYHDFHVLVEVARRKNDEASFEDECNHHELGIKDLRHRQLKLLALEHTSHISAPAESLRIVPREGEENQIDHEPFPLLSEILRRVDPHVGINVEIKYPMLQKNGLHECANYFERNLFIDRILDEIYAHAGERRIVFSSFDPDMCTQISMKQHKYPVLFLVIGATDRYVPFEDMRSDCSNLAVHFAASSKLLGLNFHSEELLKDRKPFDLAVKFNLTKFVWGDDNNEKSTQDYFKNTLQIDGIIYDRIGELEARKNVFIVEKEAKAALFAKSAQGTPMGSRRVPEYSLDSPKRYRVGGKEFLNLNVDNLPHQFIIEEFGNELISNEFELIVHEDQKTSKNSSWPERRCVYRGHSTNSNGTTVAFVGLDELTIELAVFADDALWRHFLKLYGTRADAEIHRFIMAAVNNIDVLYSQRSLQPRVNIKVVRYELMKIVPAMLSKRIHRVGDVDKLLDSFCAYQNLINPPDDRDPRHWDHALLFSGYDLYRDGLRTVAGYAPVKGMCNGIRSCTLNEGLDFGSVFVVTHEMGHSLGMYHDGDNECDMRCCIMSPSIGSGKTDWSSCSNREFNMFISKLGTRGRPPNCLLDSSRTTRSALSILFNDDYPGQKYTIDEQCSIFHGKCWKHELREGQILEDICQMVWCGNGEGVLRTAHPALEGTFCGPGMWCINGVCKEHRHFFAPTHGSWSPWNDQPKRNCATGCSACEVDGQLSIRRSIRACNNPSPNNGGYQCRGDDVKGIVCQKKACVGISTTLYASRACKSLKEDRSNPNPQLSGVGLQYGQAMCKIWCHLTKSNQIRTVGNFPDGTPCGPGHFCVKGQCRPLRCRGMVVAGSVQDCYEEHVHLARPNVMPMHNNQINVTPSPLRPKPPISNSIRDSRGVYNVGWVDKASITRTTIPPYRWSEWHEWSACYGILCGQRGIQLRTRCCEENNCPGARTERRGCTFYCGKSAALRQELQKSPPSLILTQNVQPAPERLPGAAPRALLPPNTQIKNQPAKGIAYGNDKDLLQTKRYVAESSYEKLPGQPLGEQERAFLEKTGYKPEEVDASVDQNTIVNSRVPSRAQPQNKIGTFSRFLPRSNLVQGDLIQNQLNVVPRVIAQAPPSNAQYARGWSQWTDWSQCVYPCTSGARFRRRICYYGVNLCPGSESESIPCTPDLCQQPGYNPPPYQQQQPVYYYPQQYQQPAYYQPQQQQFVYTAVQQPFYYYQG